MKLYVVGLGPGHRDLLTPLADKALQQSHYIVGYHGYIAPIKAHYPLAGMLEYALGEETQRVQKSLALASQGHIVSLVCSGDPGIYAMASLVMETHAHQGDSVAVEVIPGVSALQAIAAKSGAPLGHDFAVISLSDLLTPWTQIAARIHAALSADFVLVLYNPRAKNRESALRQCLEICSSHRSENTPVVIGRALYRPDEHVHITTLGQINPQQIDMFCTVVLGNSQTQVCQQGVYTPRGYKVKSSTLR